MKCVVLGLWHLGCVTAACLSEAGYRTIGLDFEPGVIDNLRKGKPPLFEPGLEDMVGSNLRSEKLSFTDQISVLEDADIFWVAYDTPVDDEDRADVDFVFGRVIPCFQFLKDGAIVVVSSQLPVGSIAALEDSFELQANGRKVEFVSWPENLRLGQAINVFSSGDRVILGLRSKRAETVLRPLAKRFGREILVMSVESAEMSKHALNAFLANCITFANELAVVCERVGARTDEVERALRSDARVGKEAYLKAGGPFAGGTLARDIRMLSGFCEKFELDLALLNSISVSNRNHANWPRFQLETRFGDSLPGCKVGVLGLAYKPGTDTLRRSSSIELIKWMASEGMLIRAFDPVIQSLPENLNAIVNLCLSLEDAIENIDVLIIATPWPEFTGLTASRISGLSPGVIVLDQGRFLESQLSGQPGINYIALGLPV